VIFLSLVIDWGSRYYRGAKAAVIVFDISKEGGFDCVENFRRDILQFGDPNVVIAVGALYRVDSRLFQRL
jgi:hypothetical protein